jgi:hypothetical protein
LFGGILIAKFGFVQIELALDTPPRFILEPAAAK